MRARDRRWLFGPASDLLFGCGLLYVAFFAMQVFAGDRMRAVFPLEYQPFLALALGTPHYGATLLRVYERRSNRRRYAIFAVWLTLAIAAAFWLGLRYFAIGSLLVTLYITWSPWHYSGQNYGIALMFLRRRGVEPTRAVQRWLQASFVLSFGLVTLMTHGVAPGVSFAPGSYDGTAYAFVPLGIPYARTLFAVCAAAYAAVTIAAGAALLRRARPADLAPVALIVLVQALWFAAPACARHFGVGTGIDPFQRGAYAFLWVSMGHFVQYLWITTYYAAAADGFQGESRSRHVRFLGKSLLAGGAIWVAPKLLFAPNALGALPDDLGLGILVAAVVNLHHFVLDGAIWKLRGGPVARVLLREEPAEPAAAPTLLSGAWRLGSAWRRGASVAAIAVAISLLAVAIVANVEHIALYRAAQRGDLPRALAAAQHMRWLGRASPDHHLELARLYSERGDAAATRRELDASLRVYPSARAWWLLGFLDEQEGRWEQALADHRAALALAPDYLPPLEGSVRALEALGRRDEAIAVMDRATNVRRAALEAGPSPAAP